MEIRERVRSKRKTTTEIVMTPAEAVEVIHGLAMGVKMAKFSKYNDGKWAQPTIHVDEYQEFVFKVED